MSVGISIAAVFISCTLNVLVLEMLIRRDPESTHLITLASFLFVSVEGFFNYYKFGKTERKVPLRQTARVVVLFFISNFIGNYTYSFGVSMPLVVIIRSGSLISNMLLGVLLMKKSYKPIKYVAAVIISTGISICTIASSDQKHSSDQGVPYTTWLIGVGLLILSLFLGSILGLAQEKIYNTYGKHPREVLFYFHSLPLPFFLFFWTSIYEHAVVFSQSEPVVLPILRLSFPFLWILLIVNTMAQFAGIRSVFHLTSEVSSLTVTLVLTLRKFTSLVLSVWFYSNPFSLYHWVGTALVFVGTVLFTEAYQVFTAPQKHKTQ